MLSSQKSRDNYPSAVLAPGLWAPGSPQSEHLCFLQHFLFQIQFACITIYKFFYWQEHGSKVLTISVDFPWDTFKPFLYKDVDFIKNNRKLFLTVPRNLCLSTVILYGGSEKGSSWASFIKVVNLLLQGLSSGTHLSKSHLLISSPWGQWSWGWGEHTLNSQQLLNFLK